MDRAKDRAKDRSYVAQMASDGDGIGESKNSMCGTFSPTSFELAALPADGASSIVNGRVPKRQ